jgi:pyridoxal phosphate enzyme (YggS family)
VTHITKHLENLNQRICDAANAAGRNATDISVLPVSKRQSMAAIRDAVACGLDRMAENYLQEALEKIAELPEVREWHFIGGIQSNKTRAIAEHFQWVQTVAGERVARRLSEQRPETLPELNVCVQVCTDGTGEHGGVLPDDALALCNFVVAQPRLRLRGLMTIPLPGENFEAQRKPFALVRELYESAQQSGLELDTLSMGMSGDLEAAIAEGSTMVRIGTALFGPRPG